MKKTIHYKTIEGNSAGFFTLVAILGAILAIGLGSAYYMEHSGHWVTGMTNQIVWGTPHVFALFLIVAASGALNVASIGSVFGKSMYKPLSRLSGILAILLLAEKQQGEYIPYTNHPIGWHTDGYYNAAEQQIHGMVLHCVEQAGGSGGENLILDHEIVYLLMRDANPEMIAALMQPDAMTVPANIVAGQTIRDTVSGPVFSINPASGTLHMRYSARQKNIVWKNDAMTQAGADFLLELWKHPPPQAFRYRLAAGEGIVANNVLHARTGFVDAEQSPRLLLRARSYDRIATADFARTAVSPSKMTA